LIGTILYSLNIISIGTCDPYVKVKSGKKLIFKTRRFKKNNNPQWDETFTIENVDLLDLKLQFTIKDYNRIQLNESIGEYLLDVGDVLSKQPTILEDNGERRLDFWTNVLSGRAQGQLHLKLQFIPKPMP
jgi:Ca2+-dependent lipid-binding protein